MKVVLEQIAGLDVHRDSVKACVRQPGAHGEREEIVGTFSTYTEDLLALQRLAESAGVTHVAMESTGVYCKPLYYVLEEDFEVLLVNAQHIKHVPGKKTDTEDACWMAQLLECGLLKGSFVPPPAIRSLRDLTRGRTPGTCGPTKTSDSPLWYAGILPSCGLTTSRRLCFWDYRQPARAGARLRRWMHSAMRARLQTFKELVRRLRAHLDGVLAWTRLRVSNGAPEGMTNKIKLVSHRSFGFRSVKPFTAAIYHCCAHLPLPEEC